MKNSYEVLIGPMLTEKGTLMKETDNKVLFRVARGANKIEIKKAVEEIFKVKVDCVRTINCRGKKKRMGTKWAHPLIPKKLSPAKLLI